MNEKNLIDTIRMFLENNKIFFEIISIIIFGAASIILAYASNVVSKIQTRLAEIQLDPFLYVSEKYILDPVTSKAENMILEVHNSGAEIISPIISQRTFYKVGIKRKSIYVPVNGFYYIQRNSDHPTGRLSTYEMKNNHHNYSRIYTGFLDKSFKDKYGYVELHRSTLVLVEYQTRSGKKKKQMFLGEKRVNYNRFSPLFDAHHKYQNMPAVEGISAEEVYQIAVKIMDENPEFAFDSKGLDNP